LALGGGGLFVPRLVLARLRLLRPHEMVREYRVVEVMESLLADGVQLKPILVDPKTAVILDGHHRVEALRRLGAVYAAALLVDYDDPCIRVESWREGFRVTKDRVRRAGLTGRLLPPKTSRHRPCFDVGEARVPLETLLGRQPYHASPPGPWRGQRPRPWP